MYLCSIFEPLTTVHPFRIRDMRRSRHFIKQGTQNREERNKNTLVLLPLLPFS